MSGHRALCRKLFCNYAVITTRVVGGGHLGKRSRSRRKRAWEAVAVFFRDHCTYVCAWLWAVTHHFWWTDGWFGLVGWKRERESAAAAAAQAIPCNHRHARSAARFLAFNLLLYLWTQKMTTPLAGWLPHRQHPPPAFSLRNFTARHRDGGVFLGARRELPFVFARHPSGGGTP